MKEQIRKTILENCGDNADKMKDDSLLADMIDSILFVKVVVALEEKFNFEFEDEMLAVSKFETLDDLMTYVEKAVEQS